MKNSKILFISYFILPFLALFLFNVSCSDDDNDDHHTPKENLLDTSGLDLYIKNAEKLQAGTEPSEAEWNAFFETPYYKAFLERVGDQKEPIKQTIKLTMRTAYQNLSPAGFTVDQIRTYEHNLKYKTKLNELKEYSRQLNDGTIKLRDIMANILSPYLPARLQNKDLIPPIVFTFHPLGEESTAQPDLLEMDALLNYKSDSYPLTRGYIAAHEAYHSVTGGAKNKRLIPIPKEDLRNTILSTLNLIAQEGIADLIDKDVLLRSDSPVYDLFYPLTLNEQQNSITFINNIKTVLETLSNGQPLTTIPQLNEYGGHQPGKYMGRAIRQTGGFKDLIVDPENPFAFFYVYNTAAKKLASSDYPVFSDQTISFLRGLESQLIRPL